MRGAVVLYEALEALKPEGSVICTAGRPCGSNYIYMFTDYELQFNVGSWHFDIGAQDLRRAVPVMN